MKAPTTREEVEREIARLEALYDENHRKRYATETRNSARFTYASHMTKLSRRIAQLRRSPLLGNVSERIVHLSTGSSTVKCGARMRDSLEGADVLGLDAWDLGNVSVSPPDVTCPNCRPDLEPDPAKRARAYARDPKNGRHAYFAVPTTYGIGETFHSLSEAVAAARGTIRPLSLGGFTRAFVDWREVVPTDGGGFSDTVKERIEIQRDREATYVGRGEFYSGIAIGDRVLVRDDGRGFSIQGLEDPGAWLSVRYEDADRVLEFDTENAAV